MRWLAKLLGIGGAAVPPVKALADAATGVAEVFTENKTRRMELDASARAAALAQFASEFTHQRVGWFDRSVDSLNRLPRPVMALMTLCLFFLAWFNPQEFANVMQALQTVPDQLWWILGVVVAFYFGARETHHFRKTSQARETIHVAAGVMSEAKTPPAETPDRLQRDGLPQPANAALDEWRSARSPERTS